MAAAKNRRALSFFCEGLQSRTLTPPWLRFQVLTPGSITMRAGLRIDYRLRVRGIPLHWQSEITAWDPPRRFVDEQRRGPYRTWIHEHTFEECDGGTLARDVVRYDVLGGRLVNALFVRPDTTKIFRFRQEKLRELFGSP